MPNLIIIRLHPDQPVAGDKFTSYLQGLTITAYDISFAHAKRDLATLMQIGQAKFLDGGDPNYSDNFRCLTTREQVTVRLASVVVCPCLPLPVRRTRACRNIWIQRSRASSSCPGLKIWCQC
jgi:hypothetical protein